MKTNYRRCTICKKVAPKEAFWRVVRLSPSYMVQLDIGEGRSAYLCPQADCLKAAQKKNRLGVSLKAPVPRELYQALEERLATANADDNSEEDVQSTTNSSHRSGG